MKKPQNLIPNQTNIEWWNHEKNFNYTKGSKLKIAIKKRWSKLK